MELNPHPNNIYLQTNPLKKSKEEKILLPSLGDSEPSLHISNQLNVIQNDHRSGSSGDIEGHRKKPKSQPATRTTTKTNKEKKKKDSKSFKLDWIFKSKSISSSHSTRKKEAVENLIKPQDWFKIIVGVTEPQFKQLNHSPIHYNNSKGMYIRNVVNGKITRAGHFKLLKLGNVIASITEPRLNAFGQLQKPSKPATLEIVVRNSDDRDSIKFVNVAYLQSLRKNRNAVFQVASNFNAIESIDENVSPSNSHTFTQDYVFDNTQGPAASISAGGSAICRVHAPFYNPTQPASKWGQTGNRQVNFLVNLKEHFPNVGNGYVQLTGDEPPFPSELEWDQLMENYNIGYQKNTQVTYGAKNNGHLVKVSDSAQVVDQVFCAALNIIQGVNGKKNGVVPDVDRKCKFLLKCAYEGSYLTAIAQNRKKLLLTLIGAGSFGNKIEWIYDAILNAHLKWARHPNNTLKKVVIVIYNSYSFYPPFVEQLRSHQISYNILNYQNNVPTVTDTFDPFKDKRSFSPIIVSKSSDNNPIRRRPETLSPFLGNPYRRPLTQRMSTGSSEMTSSFKRMTYQPNKLMSSSDDEGENSPEKRDDKFIIHEKEKQRAKTVEYNISDEKIESFEDFIIIIPDDKEHDNM